jgi:hypothetical protein
LAVDATKVAQARGLYEKYKPWLRRYRGGMPAGMLAAIMLHESSGRENATGDPALGEYGLFQISSIFPPTVGVSADKRYDPETNVFLGGLEFNILAVKTKLAMPDPSIVRLGTSDSWCLSRLMFAVGEGGTKALIRDATGFNPAYASQVFSTIVRYVGKTGGQVLGGQSADKVYARVMAVAEQWDIGQKIDGFYSTPEKVPAPSGMTYQIPTTIAHYMTSPLVANLTLAAILVGVGVAAAL